QLRKPVVEKMRRDRINNSIEQLKTILEKQFQKHEPSCKLDKADVLEMTVSFLKQQLKPEPVTPQVDFNEGYSRCLQETLHFMSLCAPQKGARDEMKTETQRKLLNHFQAAQNSPAHQSPVKEATPVKSALWRPW
ncbi:transcription factor HES-5-like, partial [Acipenser oxyrinchus oxyrinchus]